MPELPEVEITRRHLEQTMVGHVVVDVNVLHERTARHNASPAEIEDRLRGRRIESVGRKGKYLSILLDDGQTVVAHLGMSGRFSVDVPDDESKPHTHFLATLDTGAQVRFIDPRTFGFVAIYDEDEIERSGVGRLGPDAWNEPPTTERLAEVMKGRTAPIKALLLDQGPMAGLGNIYADEALHRARINPLTPGGDLDAEQLRRLLEATKDVLTGAIASGGTTLDDLAYLLPDGQAGENLSRLDVYGRDGEPCRRCGSQVERVVVRSRSTHFCPECQRL